MKFSPGIAQHIGARADQQDAFGFSDPAEKSFVSHGGVAAVVADGMGGLENGKEASQTAIRAHFSRRTSGKHQKKGFQKLSDALSPQPTKRSSISRVMVTPMPERAPR